MNYVVSKLFSRKFIILLVLFVVSTIFMIFGVGDTTFGGWSQFTLVLYGLYVGGNVGSQLISKNLTQKKYQDQKRRKKSPVADDDEEAI